MNALGLLRKDSDSDSSQPPIPPPAIPSGSAQAAAGTSGRGSNGPPTSAQALAGLQQIQVEI